MTKTHRTVNDVSYMLKRSAPNSNYDDGCFTFDLFSRTTGSLPVPYWAPLSRSRVLGSISAGKRSRKWKLTNGDGGSNALLRT